MSTVKNVRSRAILSFNKIIKGPETNFQSPALSQAHVRNVYHTTH